MQDTFARWTPMPRVWSEQDDLLAAAAELREALNEGSDLKDSFEFEDGGVSKTFGELPTSFNHDGSPTDFNDWSEESTLFTTPLTAFSPAATEYQHLAHSMAIPSSMSSGFNDWVEENPFCSPSPPTSIPAPTYFQDLAYSMGIPSSMSSVFNDCVDESAFYSMPPPASVGGTTDFQDVSCSTETPTTPLSVLPDPPGEPSILNPFRYVKIAFAKDIAASLRAAIGDTDTRVLDAWPETVPTMQCFFGKVDLGTVDFGGKKSGTVYHVDESISILVNYCGDSSKKVKDLYPDLPNIKVWRTILVSSSPPEREQSDWVLQDLRGFEKTAYMYNKMALYIFGGEVYFHADGDGGLHAERYDPSPYGKSYISMGPSNREVRRKPEKRLRSASDIHEHVRRNKRTLQNKCSDDCRYLSYLHQSLTAS